NKFISEDNFSGAWLTLNSKKLALPTIAECLEILMKKSLNSTFHLVAENWIRGWKNSRFYR
ncbi:MAG TPA: hypothetical protein PKY59_23105, partial [Pyrinomonadaceae bacterium]|nr:hypothetical protein [Pyrinomonadaceae bacterium]